MVEIKKFKSSFYRYFGRKKMKLMKSPFSLWNIFAGQIMFFFLFQYGFASNQVFFWGCLAIIVKTGEGLQSYLEYKKDEIELW